MGRPSKFGEPTVAMRVPASMAPLIEKMIQGNDEGFVQNSGACLEAELKSLVKRFSFLKEQDLKMVKVVSNPYYLKTALRLSCVRNHYRSIQFDLTGHETNDGCSGIFNFTEECTSLVLWMILAEVAAGLERSKGGTTFMHEWKDQLLGHEGDRCDS